MTMGVAPSPRVLEQSQEAHRVQYRVAGTSYV